MGGFPFVAVWDTRTPDAGAVCQLDFEPGARGIVACDFSPCGSYLAAVASDNQHTVYVWEWRRQKLVGEGKGCMGEPPQVSRWHAASSALRKVVPDSMLWS